MTKGLKIILLADDDVEDQELLEEAILQQAPGVRIRSVLNGKEVLNYLLTCRDNELPGLIILDYNMPELNAAEILDRIADENRYKPIPKLIWSSSNAPEHVKICREKGAEKYFVKPNSITELHKMIKSILSMYSH